jgi:hypothetical protein
MRNQFLSVEAAAALIRSGLVVIISGVEELLMSLPRGRWIGGTTPYFMSPTGGKESRTHVFCTIIDEALDARIRVLPVEQLHTIAEGRFPTGFSYLLLPAFSQAHRQFAVGAASFPGLFAQPLMGWITGVRLADIGTVRPKVVDGSSGTSYEDAGVALYCELPAGLEADLDIVNLFTQGDGPAIVFQESGLEATACTIDGAPANLALWYTEHGIDTKLPLVANYAGAMVNVSVRQVDAAKGIVHFYAPVEAGEEYHIARPVTDYAKAYAEGLGASEDAATVLSCNCVLNYLYAGLEGKTTSGFVGPVTFGEIAYIVLNQTLVRLHLVPAAHPAAA